MAGGNGSGPGRKKTSESSSSNKAKKETLCQTCSIVLKPTDTSVECETCLGWFHCGCVGFTGNNVSTLSVDGIHWLCRGCDVNFVQLSSLEKEIKYLRTSIEKSKSEVDSFYSLCSFDDRIKSLEAGLKEINETLIETCKRVECSSTGSDSGAETAKLWSAIAAMPKQINSAFDKLDSSVKDHAQEMLDRQKQEQKHENERESRAKNVILFGIDEDDDNEIVQSSTEQ